MSGGCFYPVEEQRNVGKMARLRGCTEQRSVGKMARLRGCNGSNKLGEEERVLWRGQR